MLSSLALGLLLLCAQPPAARAGEGEGELPPPPSAISCLDDSMVDAAGQTHRLKGVQKRDFLKRHRVSLSALGGFYASDSLSSTYLYGGSLSFFFAEDFGVELLATQSPVEFRLEDSFTSFDRERRFTSGTALQVMGSLLWSPMHAKLKLTEQTILHADLFFALGAGRTDHESVQGLTWDVGAGMHVYLNHYFSLRFDLRDFILPQELLGRGRITNNVTLMLGIALWLPG